MEREREESGDRRGRLLLRARKGKITCWEKGNTPEYNPQFVDPDVG